MDRQEITVLAVLFVVVSGAALLTHLIALSKLVSRPAVITVRGLLVYRGLLRTSLCRVLAAFLYVTIGTVILIHQEALPVLSLVTFSSVQLFWMINSMADVRLRRRLAIIDLRTVQKDHEQ